MSDEEKKKEKEKEIIKISFEVQEFFNWCDANDIDREVDDMDDEDRKSFNKIKNHFVKAIKEKRLTIDGTNIVYTVSRFSPSAGQSITISRPTGKDFLAMDGFKETQQMQKFNAFCASIAGEEKSFVSKLDVFDRQLIQDIGTLFITA
jgi:indole-3-glycerol phosphate synthase